MSNSKAAMDGYEETTDHSSYNTPYQDHINGESSSPWGFHNLTHAEAGASPSHRPERPRAPTRHSSLPRALFASGSGSIFGSGMQSQQQDGPAERPPMIGVTQPSDDNLTTISQPPLSTLPPTSLKARESWYDDDDQAVVDRRHIPQVEKDADDPTTPPSATRAGITRHESTTLTTLSRLFAVQASVSPTQSRSTSFTQPSKSITSYTRNLQSGETAALPDHLYSRGLLEGRHSDITVNAFGHQYKLHRLILDRAPFFRSALSEPWLEANAKDTTVRPEDIDTNITQSSFELALKRLYGCSKLHEEDRHAVGLFATGCWLEMQDLIDSSIESMLRQMTPETLSPLIKLVTSNYYGRAGDKILASAKAMLCRDGWRMSLRYWDGIPGDIIREIVGGDGFFIDGEWDRWVLAKRILDRRLRKCALEAGLVEGGSRRKVQRAPESANLMAVRFDAVYRKNSGHLGGGRGVSDSVYRWVSIYTHPDVEPLLVLLDEGIHYVHLDFEQLQFIRRARDVLGLPIMPEKVISNALWQQMELRQKVVNAKDVDMELDLSVRCAEDAIPDSGVRASRDTTMSITTPTSPPISAKGKHKVEDQPEEPVAEEEDLDSGSWDGNGKPRKFWIPSSDCNIVMGGNADPVIATSNNTTLQRHASRLSATIQPEDLQWASDFGAATSQPRPGTATGAVDGGAGGPGPAEGGAADVRYTHFPPFRFAAEFPNPRLLKEKKRVYSRTVFYAGSLWNIYIQKVASTRSKQLGVYLHRAKERETEEVIAGTAGVGHGSVDERIGMLEREMIMRSERRERRQRRRATAGSDSHEADDAETDGSAGDQDTTLVGSSNDPANTARASTMRNLLSRGNQRKSGQTDILATSPPSASTTDDLLTPESDSDSDGTADSEETARLIAASKRFHVPTLPPYVDARPKIKTYFKIYSPSRGGRMLSVYESAPDWFNFSQSWGWKSSTLMLDEGLLDGEDDVGGDEKSDGRTMKGRGDGKLRFMVVIGNI